MAFAVRRGESRRQVREIALRRRFFANSSRGAYSGGNAVYSYGTIRSASDADFGAVAPPVPVIEGGAGPCSVEFTVTRPDGKPAPAATVKVHIAYGFGGFHKLDLEAGANSEGKVKFSGLPSQVRRSQLEFEASKDQLTGTATFNPAKECQAKREIKLQERKPGGP